jgi:phage/plasmid-like protein (TIGR03299 family)
MMTQTQVSEGGQGTQLTPPQTAWMKLAMLPEEKSTAADAAQASGLNFTVELRNLHFECPVSEDTTSTMMCPVPNRRAVIRTDTNECLAIVSSGYPVLQYHEAFNFMDQVNPVYVAAGVLKGGRQGFMVIKAPGDVKLNVLDGKDPFDLYVVLRTSHDLTRAVEVMVMPVRLNTMAQLTLRTFNPGVQYRWTVRHTSTMHDKLAQALVSVKNVSDYATHFNSIAKRLNDIVVNTEKIEFIMKTVLRKSPRREQVIEEIVSRTNMIATAMTSWKKTVGVTLTGWHLVNAVGEYFDLGRAGGSPESRFLNALQGQTHIAVNRTANLLLTRFGKS